jgi:integrase
MPTEIAAPIEALPEVPDLPQAHSDDQLIEIWLHGRSVHTQRAYRADIAWFQLGAGKPLPSVTLTDLQGFADSLGDALAAASRYRILSALKSLLAFGHRIGYLPFDVGRALRLPGVRNRLTERILPEAEIHHILSLEPKERNRVLIPFAHWHVAASLALLKCQAPAPHTEAIRFGIKFPNVWHASQLLEIGWVCGAAYGKHGNLETEAAAAKPEEGRHR